jgi:predicted GH43/DUF377 family glycosyl hydrolase
MKMQLSGGPFPLVGLALAAITAHSDCDKSPPSGSSWSEPVKGPLISMGDAVPFLLWNDPSVTKENGSYRMWLSGGDPRNLERIVVEIYEARSADGIDWEIGTKPVLSPSPDGWDALRVETPSVVQVGAVYHLYYSGFDETGAKEGISAIGHATSTDGIRWTKDPRNPVVRAQSRDRHAWGFHGVGEPGVVYDPRSETFYLYYTSMRFSPADPTLGEIGILLATSKDGSRFNLHSDEAGGREIVLTRSIENAVSGAWFGYSTPAGLVDEDGRFHLFCAFIVAPAGPATARHVAIDRAVSEDGVHFEVVERGVVEAGRSDWMNQQVRSPTADRKNGRFLVWFAAETQKPHFSAGIGLVESPAEAQRAPSGRELGRLGVPSNP